MGTVFVSRARAADKRPWKKGANVLPQMTMSVEHYNRIFRMAAMNMPATLSMELKTRYTNPDSMEHNLIAEIPGTDLKDEVVSRRLLPKKNSKSDYLLLPNGIYYRGMYL